MGSSFFGNVAGDFNGIANRIGFNPMAHTPSWIDPVGSALYNAGKQNVAQNNVPFGNSFWAGKAPTLADSNAGYLQPGAGAAPAQPTRPGAAPLPRSIY